MYIIISLEVTIGMAKTIFSLPHDRFIFTEEWVRHTKIRSKHICDCIYCNRKYDYSVEYRKCSKDRATHKEIHAIEILSNESIHFPPTQCPGSFSDSPNPHNSYRQ